MASHTISVTVGSTSIQVDPETLVMTAGDEVAWAGTGPRAFSIVFEGGTPFGSRELAYAQATTRQRPLARGRFKYSVVAADNSGLRLDPVIIIEDPPSDPKP